MTKVVSNKVLVSHSSKDAVLANAISELITKCSLRQITPWYSSDNAGNGGIRAGERWFEKIRSELETSRAVVVLITPNSVTSSWVHFESGFGAATGDLEIIPVVYGFEDFNQVPDPLTHWQIFKIGQVDDCVSFMDKLFVGMDVHFDKDLVTEPVRKFVKSVEGQISFADDDVVPKPQQNEFKDLRNYLDKKFFDLASRSSSDETNFSGYEFRILNRVGTREIRVDIDIQTSFGDVLDAVYFRIDDLVEPYKYLTQWILRDEVTGAGFIIREISPEIPARLLLPPGRKVVAERLKRPYRGTDSNETHEYNRSLGGSFAKWITN